MLCSPQGFDHKGHAGRIVASRVDDALHLRGYIKEVASSSILFAHLLEDAATAFAIAVCRFLPNSASVTGPVPACAGARGTPLSQRSANRFLGAALPCNFWWSFKMGEIYLSAMFSSPRNIKLGGDCSTIMACSTVVFRNCALCGHRV